jgi:hypothetical protein
MMPSSGQSKKRDLGLLGEAEDKNLYPGKLKSSN